MPRIILGELLCCLRCCHKAPPSTNLTKCSLQLEASYQSYVPKTLDSWSVSLFHVIWSHMLNNQSNELMLLDSSFSNPLVLKVCFIKFFFFFFSVLYFTLNSADYSRMNHRKGIGHLTHYIRDPLKLFYSLQFVEN